MTNPDHHRPRSNPRPDSKPDRETRPDHQPRLHDVKPINRPDMPGISEPRSSQLHEQHQPLLPPVTVKKEPGVSDESDDEAYQQPEPEPVVVDKPDLESENVRFIRHWYRGHNSCSRTDLLYTLRPGSNRASLANKIKEEQKREKERKEEEEAKLKEEKEKHEKEKREKEKEAEKLAKKPDTPPENTTADAQVTGSYGVQRIAPEYMSPPGHPGGHPPGFPHPHPGHDMPALRTLSEYARPHSVQPGIPQPPPPPVVMGNLTGPDPMLRYQMERAYLAGNREAQIDLMERELRDRDIRQRELREMQELEMRDREIQARREHEKLHAAAMSPFLHPGAPRHHMSPSAAFPHLSDPRMPVPLSAAETAFTQSVERLNAERLHQERMMMDQSRRDSLQRPLTPHHHSHSHSHTHVHFHPQEHIHHAYNEAVAAASAGLVDPALVVAGGPVPPAPPPPPVLPPVVPGIIPPSLRPPPPTSVSLPGSHPHPILNPAIATALPPARLLGHPGMSEALAAQIHHEQQLQRRILEAESHRHLFPPRPPHL